MGGVKKRLCETTAAKPSKGPYDIAIFTTRRCFLYSNVSLIISCAMHTIYASFMDILVSVEFANKLTVFIRSIAKNNDNTKKVQHDCSTYII